MLVKIRHCDFQKRASLGCFQSLNPCLQTVTQTFEMKGTIHNKFEKLGKYGIGGDQEQSCRLEETPVSLRGFLP